MSTHTRWALVAIALGVWAVLVFAMVTDAHAATPPFPPSVVATKADPDQTGVRASAYTGRYYRAGDEGYRRCIAQREGSGVYGVESANGLYFGTYQFTAALARGAAWEMAPELRALWPSHWRVIRNLLIETPMSRWSRWYQDAAFYTILNVDGVHEGAPHWFNGRWECHPGMTWRGVR